MATYNKREVNELKTLIAGLCRKVKSKENESNALRAENEKLRKQIVKMQKNCESNHVHNLKTADKSAKRLKTIILRLTEKCRKLSQEQPILANKISSLEQVLSETEVELEKERRLRIAQRDTLDNEYKAVAEDLEKILEKSVSLERADDIVKRTLKRASQSEDRESRLLQRCCILQDKLDVFSNDVMTVSIKDDHQG